MMPRFPWMRRQASRPNSKRMSRCLKTSTSSRKTLERQKNTTNPICLLWFLPSSTAQSSRRFRFRFKSIKRNQPLSSPPELKHWNTRLLSLIRTLGSMKTYMLLWTLSTKMPRMMLLSWSESLFLFFYFLTQKLKNNRQSCIIYSNT